MANFKLDGAYDHKDGLPTVAVVESDLFDTLAEAEAVAARFPKYLRVYANKCYSGKPGGPVKGHIRMRIDLSANGANGGINEAGIKRFLKLLEKLNRFGHTTEWAGDYVTSYESLNEFLHALDG